MKTKLTVRNRFDLQSVIPKEGDLTAMKMIREVREDLSFSQEEHDQFEIKIFPNGGVSWNATKAEEVDNKEVTIPQTIVELIQKALEKLNVDKRIQDEHIDLYDMFIENEPKEAKIVHKKDNQ